MTLFSTILILASIIYIANIIKKYQSDESFLQDRIISLEERVLRLENMIEEELELKKESVTRLVETNRICSEYDQEVAKVEIGIKEAKEEEDALELRAQKEQFKRDSNSGLNSAFR